MDSTGRRYCPCTKREEEKLLNMNKYFEGNISKVMKYFPNRSPDSLIKKIQNLNVK